MNDWMNKPFCDWRSWLSCYLECLNCKCHQPFKSLLGHKREFTGSHSPHLGCQRCSWAHGHLEPEPSSLLSCLISAFQLHFLLMQSSFCILRSGDMDASIISKISTIREGLRVFPYATLESGIRVSWFSLCAHSYDHVREPKLGQDFLLGSGGGTVSLKKECSRETVSVLCTLNVKNLLFALFQSSSFLRTLGLCNYTALIVNSKCSSWATE